MLKYQHSRCRERPRCYFQMKTKLSVSEASKLQHMQKKTAPLRATNINKTIHLGHILYNYIFVYKSISFKNSKIVSPATFVID